MKRLFVDTGAWFAFFNQADPDHEAVSELLLDWENLLLTTDYVFDELITLLRYRVDHHTAVKAGIALKNPSITMLVYLQPDDRDKAWKQFQRDHDKKYSFTDCTSFAVMMRLKIHQAAAVDNDFRRAGFRTLPD